jgi:hypothetical protein
MVVLQPRSQHQDRLVIYHKDSNMLAANKVHKSAVAVIPSFRLTQTVQRLRCFKDKSFLVGAEAWRVDAAKQQQVLQYWC